MQKDQTLNLDEAKDKLKQAGVTEDEMAALERQLAPAIEDSAKDNSRKVGFVSAGVEESQADGVPKVTAHQEDIELPDESDSEEDEKVEIAQKEVPSAVFGGLARKKEDSDETDREKDDDSHLGALERIKRQKKA